MKKKKIVPKMTRQQKLDRLHFLMGYVSFGDASGKAARFVEELAYEIRRKD